MIKTLAAAFGLSLALSIPASALTFSATLSGGQEAPTPVVTGGTGTALATYDEIANSLRVELSFSGLSANASDAHIHCCGTTAVAVGVAIGFSAAGFPLGVTSGTYDHVFDLGNTSTYTAGFLTNFGGGTANGARDALLLAMGATNSSSRAYFNIHTSAFPGGEIRGNIVPEPATALLLWSGLMAVAFLRRVR